MHDPPLTRYAAIETGAAAYLVHLGGLTTPKSGPGAQTRRAYASDLAQFTRFLHTCIAGPTVANVPVDAVDAFARHLAADGRKPRTVARKLAAVRGLFRYLCGLGVCPRNPARGIRPADAVHDAPVLTPDQMRALLAVPGRESFADARTRALLELLYGSGLRLDELMGLNLSHLDLENGRLHVRGARARAVPLGAPATASLKAYLLRRAEVLVECEIEAVEAGALFVSARGRRLHPRTVQRAVERSLRALEKGEVASAEATRGHRGPGRLRAACARHLIEAGADPGLVAALMGRRTGVPGGAPGPIDLERVAARYRQAHPRA